MEDGRVDPNLRITYTPSVYAFLSGKKIPSEWKERFWKKIANLVRELKEYKRPITGWVKAARSCETTIFYLKLRKDLRILFDYDNSTIPMRVTILEVSGKGTNEFNEKLRKSAEHLVHARSFDSLDWHGEGIKLDLSKMTANQLEEFHLTAKSQFESQPKEQQEWNYALMNERAERASIYEMRFPKAIDDMDVDYINDLPPILKLQPGQEELLQPQQFFLLEGVAGTGKTTILLHRLERDIRRALDAELPSDWIEDGKKSDKRKLALKKAMERFLFITHNPRLRNDVKKQLKYFFTEDDLRIIDQRVLTFEDLIDKLIESRDGFDDEHRLKKRHFAKLIGDSKEDSDLFFEEYRGILRGYNLHGTSRLIDLEEYEEIGRKRGRLDSHMRSKFYEIGKKVEKRLRAHPILDPAEKGWDDLQICKFAFKRIQNNPELKKLDIIYIDEVQDLTAAEIELLLTMLNPEGARKIAVAGDLAQSVQPSSFTWPALREIITDVLGENPPKESKLDQNYRSTPYLVDAANHILRRQHDVEGISSMTLQCPFAFENLGDPVLLITEEEEVLIELLNKYELPNALCPILVRSKDTKDWLKGQLKSENKAFVETFAGFKGLEEKSILIWNPAEGSSSYLDRLDDPVRGEQFRKRDYSKQTELLELRQVFVGFTRARYLMGILCDDDSHFVKELESLDCFALVRNLRLKDFVDDIDTETYLSHAEHYENAGQYDMAAQCYINAGLVHEGLRCKALEYIENEDYPPAFQSLIDAIEKTPEKEDPNPLRVQLMEHSKSFRNTAADDSKREEMLADLGFHASILEEHDKVAEFDAIRLEILANRSNDPKRWKAAAKAHEHADNLKEAAACYSKGKDLLNLARIMIKRNKETKAKTILLDYLENRDPRSAISAALGINSVVEQLRKILPVEFKQLDLTNINKAEEIAKKNHLGNYLEKQRIEMVLQKGNKKIDDYKSLFNSYRRLKRWDLIIGMINNNQVRFLDEPGKEEEKFRCNLFGKNIEEVMHGLLETTDPSVFAKRLKQTKKKMDWKNIDLLKQLNKIRKSSGRELDSHWEVCSNRNEQVREFDLLKLICNCSNVTESRLESVLEKLWDLSLKCSVSNYAGEANLVAWIAISLINKSKNNVQLIHHLRMKSWEIVLSGGHKSHPKGGLIAFILFMAEQNKILMHLGDLHHILPKKVHMDALHFTLLRRYRSKPSSQLDFASSFLPPGFKNIDTYEGMIQQQATWSKEGATSYTKVINRFFKGLKRDKGYLIESTPSFNVSFDWKECVKLFWSIKKSKLNFSDSIELDPDDMGVSQKDEEESNIETKKELEPKNTTLDDKKEVGDDIDVSEELDILEEDGSISELGDDLFEETADPLVIEAIDFEEETESDDVSLNDIYRKSIGDKDPYEIAKSVLKDKIRSQSPEMIFEILTSTFSKCDSNVFPPINEIAMMIAIYELAQKLEADGNIQCMGGYEKKQIQLHAKPLVPGMAKNQEKYPWWHKLLLQ